MNFTYVYTDALKQTGHLVVHEDETHRSAYVAMVKLAGWKVVALEYDELDAFGITNSELADTMHAAQAKAKFLREIND